MKASEYLQRRHDELALGGVEWVNHIPLAPWEACLVAGGQYPVSPVSPHRVPAVYCYVVRALALEPQGLQRSIGRWNDAPERTLDEVLEVILRAKKLAEAEDD